MEGGISCPWCVWKALAAPSPLLSYSQSSCSLSFLEGMGKPWGNLCNKWSSCNHGVDFPSRKRSWTIPPAALLPLLRPRKVWNRGEQSLSLMIGKDRKFPFPLGGSGSRAQAAPMEQSCILLHRRCYTQTLCQRKYLEKKVKQIFHHHVQTWGFSWANSGVSLLWKHFFKFILQMKLCLHQM